MDTIPPAFPEKYYQDPTGIDRYVVQEKILFEWQAPTKLPAVSLPRLGAWAVVLLVGLGAALFFTGDVMIIPLVVVVGFVYHLVTSRPMIYIPCKVTTLGIKVEDKYYYWQQLVQYWIEVRRGVPVLIVRNIFPRVDQLKLIISDNDMELLMTTIGKYILYKKPQETFVRRFTVWFRSLLPFDLDFL